MLSACCVAGLGRQADQVLTADESDFSAAVALMLRICLWFQSYDRPA